MVSNLILGLVLGSGLALDTAPKLDIKDTKGNLWTIEKLTQNKVYLIEFWATWCTTCKKIAPDVEAFVKEYRGEKLEYLSISVDSDKSALISYLKSKKPEWPVLLDPELKAAERWKALEIPRLAFVRNGAVLWRRTGEVKRSELDEAFQAAMRASQG